MANTRNIFVTERVRSLAGDARRHRWIAIFNGHPTWLAHIQIANPDPQTPVKVSLHVRGRLRVTPYLLASIPASIISETLKQYNPFRQKRLHGCISTNKSHHSTTSLNILHCMLSRHLVLESPWHYHKLHEGNVS